jgi:DnaJ-class molecular chaperone
MEDPYKILGVTKDADQKEIKSSFRALARKHHPDKPGGDESKFKEIQAAYEILSDPDKRSQYDNGGSEMLNNIDLSHVDINQMDFASVFESIFMQPSSNLRYKQTASNFEWFPLPGDASYQPQPDPKLKVRVAKNKIQPGTKLAIKNRAGEQVKFKLPSNVHPGSVLRLAGKDGFGNDLIIEIIAK